MKIGLPKGRLEGRTLDLLGGNNFVQETRKLTWTVDGQTFIRMRPHQIPPAICHGLLDEGICGSDSLWEFPMRHLLRVMASVPQPGVRMVVAAADPELLSHLPARPLVIGTSYPNLASEVFAGIPHILVEQSGCIEGLCPILVDAIVDIVETGETLRANGLHVLHDMGELSLVRIRKVHPDSFQDVTVVVRHDPSQSLLFQRSLRQQVKAMIQEIKRHDDE